MTLPTISLLILSLITFSAHASDYHSPPSTTTDGRSEGVALSIATSQHHFDFGTHSLQGSVGAGSFNGNSAISFGMAKRLDRVLINGSIGTEKGDSAIGVGVNWRF